MAPTSPVGMYQQPGHVGGIGTSSESLTYRSGPAEWAKYFGPTSRPIENQQYGAYRVENNTLPDAYVGRNSFLTTVIINMVTEAARSALLPAHVTVPHTPPLVAGVMVVSMYVPLALSAVRLNL